MKSRNFSCKRSAILNKIKSTKCHPSAEWVFSQLKSDYPRLSLGTVYRNISDFKKDGLIISIGVVDGKERFDGNTSPHTHFICSSCGSVIDIDIPLQGEEYLQNAAQIHGVQVDSYDLVLHGKCPKCLDISAAI